MAKTKDLSQTYQKHTHQEHIFEIPDTYIGSIESCTEDFWYFDNESNSMIKKELTIIRMSSASDPINIKTEELMFSVFKEIGNALV